jgi:hypothetical protein
MARYGKAAGKSVKSAMQRRKHGTLRSGKAGKGGRGQEPEAGHCHWAFRGPEKGSKGPEKAFELIDAAALF